jgi:hypothetical protein
LSDTLKIISIYATITLIAGALVLQMMRVYVFKKSLRKAFKVEKEEIKKNPEQLKSIR